MSIPRSKVPLFAVLLLTSARWTALPAQEPSEPRTPAAVQVPPGEIPGVRTLTPAELETTRQALPGPLPGPPVAAINPAQVHPGDHVASGISLRNRGGGVINLRGAPAGASPVKALLYWDVLVASAPSTMAVSINGVSVVGAKIGQGPGPAWGTALNGAYRADVPLYLLYIGINGDYSIAGVPSSKGTGDNPWQPPFAAAPLAEGATLVVIYRHPSSTFTKTYLYEAPIAGTMFCSTFQTSLGGFNPPAPLAQAKFTMIGADGQIGSGLSASFPVTAEKSFFQGQQIAGPGSTTATGTGRTWSR